MTTLCLTSWSSYSWLSVNGRCRDSMMLSSGNGLSSQNILIRDSGLFKTTSAFSAPGANEELCVEGDSRHAHRTEILFFNQR